MSHEPISYAGTSQETPHKEANPEVVPIEGRNPVKDKGKRRVAYSP